MPAMRKDLFPAIAPSLYGGRINHLRRELLMAFEHGAAHTAAAQPLTDWLSTSLASGAEFMGSSFSGGGGATLPATANGILMDDVTIPSVAVSGVVALPALTTYNYVDGVQTGTVTPAWGTLPAGTLPGMDGAITIDGSNITGLTAGTAALTLSLSYGAVGAGNVAITYVFGVAVSGGA